MDPARRVLFLVLFASVLAAEPTHAQVAGPERVDLPAAARWVQRLTISLRRAVQSTPAVAKPRPRVAVARPLVIHAQVFVHPALLPHAFRLPPPTLA